MTDPQREESESGKFSWWTHVKNMPIAALSTVYDVLTAKYSLCVSRGCGKNTFSEEYSASQTGTIIITGAAGYVIHVVGVYVATVSATGVVEIDYVGDIQKIFRVYATKYNQAGEDDFAFRGAPGESVKLTSTTGDNVLFVAVNYRKVAAVEADYNNLTVADFQKNAATGNFTNPEYLNDDNSTQSTYTNTIDQYCEIAFSKVFRLNKYRYFGNVLHNNDGTFTIQYFNLTTGAWTDWLTDIPTRPGTWSEWLSGPTIVTTKIKLIATAIDTAIPTSIVGELELKYEA